RLGRQELNAEILDDVPGALWSRALIEETRWPVHRNIPDLVRIVVAIDPAASTGEDADETGGRARCRRQADRSRIQARAPRSGARSDIEAAKAMLANPDIGVTQIAHGLGVSPATLYRYIPAARTANTPRRCLTTAALPPRPGDPGGFQPAAGGGSAPIAAARVTTRLGPGGP
ncbi:MAG TPA: helix-turn-helix domain-containing protein, partial [Stellaceae bacterium]|nr:helix-turn-helix domain-containing protein [Stellaceae bacterium]